MYQLAEGLRHAATMFLPFIPNAASKILRDLSVDPEMVQLPRDAAWGGLKPGAEVKKEILFPRLDPKTE
jgi:methionyl-tRNA synthetase